MVLVQVLHPVVVARPSPRSGRPRLHAASVTTPLDVVHEADGFLAPLPPGFPALLTRPDRAQPFVERTLRLGPGGLWGMLRIPDLEEAAAARELEDGWGDGFGIDEYGNVEILPPDEAHIRAATAVEAVFILKGMERPIPRAQTWLRLTPFCTALPVDPMPDSDPDPTPDEVAGSRARLSRWAGANLRFCQDALWIRFGAPCKPIPSLLVDPWLHPTGNGLDLADFPDAHFARVPRLASALEPERALAYARRMGIRPGIQGEAAPFGACLEIRGYLGAEGTHDGAPDAFANLACVHALAMAGRTGGKRASSEAAALRPALDAAVADLAPWAALGMAWSIERADWPDALAAVERVARLLVRSHPWSRDVEELEGILAYAEEAVLPLLRVDDADEDILAGLAPTGGGERAGGDPAPFAFPAAALTNAPVVGPDGTGIGRLVSFTMGADGRAVSALLKVGSRRIEVPFGAFAFEPGLRDGAVLVTVDPASLEGLVPMPAAARAR